MRHSEFPKVRPTVDSSQGYELRDISIPVIGRWVIILFIFMAISAGVAWGSFRIFVPGNTHESAISPMKPSETAADRLAPPQPVIQAYPKNDMKDFREQEQAKVDGYGWNDKNTGVVRLPIEEAMKQTAQRGLTFGQTGANSPGYSPASSAYHYPNAEPVGTDAGYKPPVTYRKYPY